MPGNLCSVSWAHCSLPRARRSCTGGLSWLSVPDRASRALLENCIASTSILFSKLQEPTVDALAPEADEGRGWLR